MTQQEMENKFNKEVKVKNFMTPEQLEFYMNKGKDIIIELSHGYGFEHEDIYGVSVLSITVNSLLHEQSKMFFNQIEAFDHIDRLMDF